MLKKISAIFAIVAVLLVPAVASAHIAVKPAEILTGSFQTFTMGVPNEKDSTIIQLRLEIPAGLQYVSPTVKNGWNIATEKTGEGESAAITSITWDGGAIGAGLRDDFTFSAKAPDAAASLNWKAYQTYDDGTTVAWDQKPTAKESESDTAGPYSVTSVAKTATAVAAAPVAAATTDRTAKYLSIGALAVSLVAFAIATRPHKKR
ncbi:YcnI family protein [Aeromicrobium sp.]|nr:YcnI family protein [Candidatus Saccharibacteria bacterium]